MRTVTRVEINGWLRLLEDAEALMRRFPLSGDAKVAMHVGTAIGKVMGVRREIQAATVTDMVIDDA